MPTKKITGYLVGGGIFLILVFWIIASYNSLIKRDEKVKQHWGEVQNTYQRRLDLVPKLVRVVKGVSDFEQTTLEKIAEARSNAQAAQTNDSISPENYRRLERSQDSLAAAANRLMLVVENYPVLKGTAAYAGLQTQLEGTERRIRVARNDFNRSVAEYNKKVRSFPVSLVAGLLGFKKREGFEAVAGAEKGVEIKFK